VIHKGYWEFKDLWEAFEPIQVSQYKSILHFRLATHGDVDWHNCHPYELVDGALIHNGIIEATSGWYARQRMHGPNANVKKDNRTGANVLSIPSDTRDFVEHYIGGMDELQLRKAGRLIENAIGDYSKVVTLHDSGRHIIFNESGGHWDRGAWYSNSCYRLNGAQK
jgi:predicted glutamine amidotransferase